MRPGRTIVAAMSALALVATGGVLRLGLEAQSKPPTSSELLYLPRGPFLRALAFGHEETLADLIYIWALNYYSSYQKEARRQYLSAVFSDAITELDPRFTESYVIGAMVMSLEYRQPDDALKLYQKGLRAMPTNWELAYWAGWECYSSKRFLDARSYWRSASKMPGAPPFFMRLAARMLEKAGDLDAAISEYEQLLDDAPDEKTRAVVARWLERMKAERQAQRSSTERSDQ